MTFQHITPEKVETWAVGYSTVDQLAGDLAGTPATITVVTTPVTSNSRIRTVVLGTPETDLPVTDPADIALFADLVEDFKNQAA